LELAKFGFKRSIGIDPSDETRYTVSIHDFKVADITPPDASESALIDSAIAMRPDFKVVKLGIETLQQMEKLEKTDYLPHLNAWFNYNLHNDDGFDDAGNNWDTGASVHLNLFNGLATSGKVKQVKSRIAAMKQQKMYLRQQIIWEVQKACRNLNTGLARIAVTQEAIKSGEETLRILSARYTSGLIPILHVTDAEVALIQAETSHVKALHDAHLAAAQIDLAVGEINHSEQSDRL